MWWEFLKEELSRKRAEPRAKLKSWGGSWRVPEATKWSEVELKGEGLIKQTTMPNRKRDRDDVGICMDSESKGREGHRTEVRPENDTVWFMMNKLTLAAVLKITSPQNGRSDRWALAGGCMSIQLGADGTRGQNPHNEACEMYTFNIHFDAAPAGGEGERRQRLLQYLFQQRSKQKMTAHQKTYDICKK